MNNYQRTLKRSVSFFGVALHSGDIVHVEIHPAPANTGIYFQRVDLPNKPKIKAISSIFLHKQMGKEGKIILIIAIPTHF